MAALLEASVGRRVVVRYRKPQSLRAADSSDDSSAWSQSSRPLELLAVELAADPSAVKNTAAAAAATAADGSARAVTRAAADSGSPEGVAPPDIASVVFLYSMCGYRRAIDEAAFRALWFNTGRTRPNDYTMQNYIQKCSFGRSKLTNSTQLVFEVDVPCRGTGPGGRYNSKVACGDAEQAAWSQAAEELVQRQWDIDLTPYKQRIGVLPNEVSKICGFGGRGSVGCAERCYTWITHDYASNLVYFLHEMGHNWGLRHATAYDSASATGDWSCIMGTAGACLNAANGWKMGWALPLPGADLNGSTMPPGTWLPYFVPYQSTAHASHVRIYPSWVPTNSTDLGGGLPAPAFFISARIEDLPFEGGVLDDYWDEHFDSPPGMVFVHTSQNSQEPVPYLASHMEAALNASQQYRAPPPYDIVVRVDRLDGATGASVTVCRSEQEAESRNDGSCYDGIDNDCDGLTDQQDQDCQTGALKPPPPARAQPQRPPRSEWGSDSPPPPPPPSPPRLL
ncbi:hypothetical protein HYH03_005181 [Edaphochlamys debaryana]|uniref:Peptidase M11 gametolysin domain-containing protein n=1 Tax=Edaphochlamys debaryana TaxID=47281 RepID=A0A835Y691_9CHLO|nr:hypothetical protein HYH03_005181 [Edaphochlamys debaryana]|eukprot:KAG2496773.1 hypothetical protein HYH03_005181 [Edaphochlamys debaryana]